MWCPVPLPFFFQLSLHDRSLSLRARTRQVNFISVITVHLSNMLASIAWGISSSINTVTVVLLPHSPWLTFSTVPHPNIRGGDLFGRSRLHFVCHFNVCLNICRGNRDPVNWCILLCSSQVHKMEPNSKNRTPKSLSQPWFLSTSGCSGREYFYLFIYRMHPDTLMHINFKIYCMYILMIMIVMIFIQWLTLFS